MFLPKNPLTTSTGGKYVNGDGPSPKTLNNPCTIEGDGASTDPENRSIQYPDVDFTI